MFSYNSKTKITNFEFDIGIIDFMDLNYAKPKMLE